MVFTQFLSFDLTTVKISILTTSIEQTPAMRKMAEFYLKLEEVSKI